MTAILVTALVLVAYFGVPLAYMRWQRVRARARHQESREIVLTFDDGPSDVMSDRILDCLDRHEIRAAHFVTTCNLDDREDKIRRAMERGDVVGCHGHRHVHQWKSAPWAGIRDIRQGWQRLERVTGQKASRAPFRPPYGKLNLLSLIYLWLHRTPIAIWTFDSKDTWPELPGPAKDAADDIRREGGGIVLLHDYDREDPTVNDYVLEVVESLANDPAPGGRIAQPTAATFR